MDRARQIECLILSAGILVSFIIVAMLQEKVNQDEYGEEKERFSFFSTLVLTQCICFAAVSKGDIFLLHVVYHVKNMASY